MSATVQHRKLTLTQAVDQWAECQLAMEGLKELRDQAAKVLLDHAERTGRRTYKDRIAVEGTGGSLVLDQPAVREALPAARFVEGDLMKRTKRGLSLKLLR